MPTLARLIVTLEADSAKFRRDMAESASLMRSVEGTSRSLEGAQEQLGSGFLGTARNIIAVHAGIHLLELGARKAAIASQELAQSSNALGRSFAALNAGVASIHTRITSLAATGMAVLRFTVIGLAVALGTMLVGAITKAFDRLGQLGAGIAITRQGFSNLARSVGETGDSLDLRLRRATLGTVDNFSLLKTGTLALLTGVAKTGRQFEEMARIATILSLATGKSAAEGFDILTTGIARHSTMLLKQLGIVVEANDAYERYAKKLGTTVGALSDAQKAQAFQNEVMQVARKHVKDLNLDMNSLAVVNAQAAASALNVKLAFAEEVAESRQLIEFKKELLGLTIDFRTALEFLAPVLGALTDLWFAFMRVGIAPLRGYVEMLRLFAAAAENAAEALFGFDSELQKDIDLFAELESQRLQKVIEMRNRFNEMMREGGALRGIDTKALQIDTSALIGEMRTLEQDFVAGEIAALHMQESMRALASSLVDVEGTIENMLEAARRAWDQFEQQMARPFEGLATLQDTVAIASQMTRSELEQTILTLDRLGLSASEIAVQIGASIEDVQRVLDSAGGNIEKQMARIGVDAGTQLMMGLIQGTLDAKQLLMSILSAIIRAALFSALELGSPSKLGIFGGMKLAEGIAHGFARTRTQLEAALMGGIRLPTAHALAAARPQPASIRVTGGLDLSGMPQPRDPLAAARDSEWIKFLSESVKQARFSGVRFG